MLTASSILLGIAQFSSPAVTIEAPKAITAKIQKTKAKVLERQKSPKSGFLIPVHKQTFKQNRRKELKKSARRKAK